jgi:predicted molibdopterin-dependent oxidoreductase YjgC
MGRLKDKWKTDDIASSETRCLHEQLLDGKVKNLFIFGEDPVGCALDRSYVESIFKPAEFVVVQDYFMTATTAKADLILPASLPAETGGSFTNSQKVLQQFQAGMKPGTELTSLQQVAAMLEAFGHKGSSNPVDIFMEVVTLFPEKKGEEKLQLHITEKDDHKRRYNYGCDAVTKRFEEEFEKQIAR